MFRNWGIIDESASHRSKWFLARNLISHLNFRAEIEVIPYTRQNQISELKDMLVGVETIFHLAGAIDHLTKSNSN